MSVPSNCVLVLCGPPWAHARFRTGLMQRREIPHGSHAPSARHRLKQGTGQRMPKARADRNMRFPMHAHTATRHRHRHHHQEAGPHCLARAHARMRAAMRAPACRTCGRHACMTLARRCRAPAHAHAPHALRAHMRAHTIDGQMSACTWCMSSVTCTTHDHVATC